MGFRFRRTIKIAPGMRVNLNKSSVSLRLGGRGAGYTISSNGSRTRSVGIPGTGISWVDRSSGKRRESEPAPAAPPATTHESTVHEPAPSRPEPFGAPRTIAANPPGAWWAHPLLTIALLLTLPPVGVIFMWAFQPWPLSGKVAITAFVVLLLALFL